MGRFRFMRTIWAILLILLCCLGSLAGCHHGVYTASMLPPQLAARPVIDVQSLDLSRLGSPAAYSEIVLPGDTLQVTTVTGAEEEQRKPWELRVGEDGAADVPLIGPVHVAGLNLVQAETVIREAGMRRRVFRKPAVRVTISGRRVNRVTVTGAVKNPQTYELPAAASNLAAALLAAGGLSASADRLVEIRRPAALGGRLGEPTNGTSTAAAFTSLPGRAAASAEQTVLVDLLDAVGHAGHEYLLEDGSTVSVRQKPDGYVHLIGLTGNRVLELPHHRNVRVLDALAEAGGPKYSIWIADKVKVIRPVPGSDETVTVKVSIRKAKRDASENILLASGDIVSVEENLVTFTLGTLGQLVGIGTTAATGAAAGLAP